MLIQNNSFKKERAGVDGFNCRISVAEDRLQTAQQTDVLAQES